ncbi:Na(+)/H(+) antiporter subunit B [Coraliomargarita sinensis]|uniref:Na(+)/H(+) antiporter subunit B n=1 Tax=Coraliomargarita sinensis TaxID=2174842 RepID=A0A317ZLC8_9BACT|nr:MnhB domain-containing protein [Coraliomargarita sinensis]PXA04748.1 Na(+)/H(+) antiporter subunit B [Coraliomargarita sinensis]
MRYFILAQAARILFPSLLVLSLIVLYRGHNLPGGGFIGGLMAATAFILVGISESMDRAKRLLRIEPFVLMAWGLATAAGSGLPGLFTGSAFMTGQWLPGFSLPLIGKVHLGTPLVFDVGVYLVVIGFALHTTFSLAQLCHTEEEEET